MWFVFDFYSCTDNFSSSLVRNPGVVKTRVLESGGPDSESWLAVCLPHCVKKFI